MPINPPADQFKAARERAGQRAVGDQQNADDAIKRRFTAMGAVNSGAAVKAGQQAQASISRNRDEAIATVDAAEAQRNDRIDERDFAAGEAEKQRSFASKEGLMGREFQSGEAEKGRGFQREQSGIDRAFQEKVFSFDSSSKLRQMDLADKDFALKKDESEWNKRLEEYKIGNSGGFFGGGGFMGLGIDTHSVKI
jgi:hypothetical protein